jgi:peptidoglycan hydrolase CwlO-like protein
MKTKALIICVMLIGIFSAAHSQKLTDPEISFSSNWQTRSSGTFLVVDYGKIWLSELTYDKIKQWEKNTENLSSKSDNMQRTIDGMKRTIDDMKRTIDGMQRIIDEQKRTIDNLTRKTDRLENITEQQNRKISDLERKIK